MKYLHSNKRKRKWKVAKHQDWKRWCEMSLKVLGSVENGECSGHLDPSLLSNSQPHWHPELGVNMKLDVHRWETEKGNVFRFGGGGGDQKGKFQLFSLHYGCYRKGLGSHLPGFRDSLATPFPWTNSWQQQGTPAPSHAPGWWVTHHEVSQHWRRCWEAHESLNWFSSSRFLSWHLFPNCINPWGPGPLAALDSSCQNRPLANYAGTSGLIWESWKAHPKGGERTGRRRGAGRPRETVVALCPTSQMCNSFLPCSVGHRP